MKTVIACGVVGGVGGVAAALLLPAFVSWALVGLAVISAGYLAGWDS